MSARIAVTGAGMVSALGGSLAETFTRLYRGDRGFSPITLFDTERQRTRFAAEVPGFRPADVLPRGSAEPWSRCDALALVAAREAVASAGASALAGRVGISVGVTTAGMLEAEQLLARPRQEATGEALAWLVSYPLSSTADRLASALAPGARVATLASACSSGASAIVQGAAWVLSGTADVVVAGGTDSLCSLTFTGFNALGAVDVVPCRPFDRRRAGLTLGEGAGFLVLESEERAVRRGATVLAWLSGWAAGAEAHHITRPEPTAATPIRLLRAALASACLGPADVDYVNAHGTATVQNDAVETLALRQALGRESERIYTSSSKGQIGHTLGAAGALEAAITVVAISRGEVPPTGGLEEVDEACLLRHVPGRGVRADLRAALSLSLGFGGTATALAFEHAAAPSRRAPPGSPIRVVVTGASTLDGHGVLRGADAARALDRLGANDRLPFDARDLVVPASSRRFDAQACLVAAGAGAALEPNAPPPEVTGLVVGTAFGNVDRTVAFLRAAVEKGPGRVPPAEFPHLVPSAASGNGSVYLRLGGPVLTTSDLEAGGESAFHIAADWLGAGFAPALVAGSAEPFDPIVDELLGPACEMEAGFARGEGSGWVLLESEASARERGARALAVVVSRWNVPRSELDAVELDGPPPGSRAMVVSAHGVGDALGLLQRSGWGAVPSRVVAEAGGWHEALGAIALAAGVGLLARGDADHVLVHGGNARRVSLVLLARATA